MPSESPAGKTPTRASLELLCYYLHNKWESNVYYACHVQSREGIYAAASSRMYGNKNESLVKPGSLNISFLKL